MRENRTKHSQHAKDAPQRVVRPRQVDLGLEKDLGVRVGGRSSALLDELNLLVDPLRRLDI
jgi:hypothetical protein